VGGKDRNKIQILQITTISFSRIRNLVICQIFDGSIPVNDYATSRSFHKKSPNKNVLPAKNYQSQVLYKIYFSPLILQKSKLTSRQKIANCKKAPNKTRYPQLTIIQLCQYPPQTPKNTTKAISPFQPSA
jgi:hypothetical protein